MKLNFWQWLGMALLVIGLILILRNRISPDTDNTNVPSTTQSR